jgi:hypothetical protein
MEKTKEGEILMNIRVVIALLILLLALQISCMVAFIMAAGVQTSERIELNEY